MFQTYASRKLAVLSLLLLTIYSLFLLWMTDLNNLAAEMAEDGLIETQQLLVLAAAALAFFLGGMRSHEAPRMFAVGLCVLILVFFFRELEVEPTGPLSSYLKSRAFRWHEAFIVGLIATIYIRRHSDYVRPVMQFIFSRQAWLFHLSAALVIFGEVFEKMHGFVYHQLVEEIMESQSYLLLLCLGICSLLSHSEPVPATART